MAGVMLFESSGNYYCMSMADDRMYEAIMEDGLSTDELVEAYRMRVLGGKNGIVGEERERISKAIHGLAQRLNGGESLNIKRELASIL